MGQAELESHYYVHHINFTPDTCIPLHCIRCITLKFSSYSMEIQLVQEIYRITFTSTLNAIGYHTHIMAVKIEAIPTGFLVNHTKNVVVIHNKII